MSGFPPPPSNFHTLPPMPTFPAYSSQTQPPFSSELYSSNSHGFILPEEQAKKQNSPPKKNRNALTKSSSSIPNRKSNGKRDKHEKGTFEPLKADVFTEDFDFEGNNAKFNKAEVFRELVLQA